jgi:lambda family phage portal protein
MGLRTRLFRAMGFEPMRPRQRAYQGARVSRLTADWVTSGTSADSEIKSSFKALRNRARQLCRDNDYARQALRAIQNNVIGQGIRHQGQVRMLRGGKLDDAINEQIHEAFEKWMNKSRCDVSGILGFHDLERLLVRSLAESGEVFVRMIRRPFGDSKVPFALQVLEADYLIDDDVPQARDGNTVRMGIEVDQYLRPQAYHFYANHPGDVYAGNVRSNAKRIRVPADEVIHLFLPERPGQTRGVTWFASALMRLHMLQGYEEAEVVRARASSALMGFIQSPEGELVGDEVYDNERVSEFSPGVFKYLAPGESVTVPDLNAPDGQLEPFTRSMLRAVAAGIGVSFESISKNFSESNYSSSRLSLLEERDTYRVLQRYMIENFHQLVFNNWLEMAVLSGALNLPGYESNPDRYRASKWVPRSWEWVDPQREVDAYKTAVRCGFKTLAQVITEQGGDLDAVLMQRQSELAKLDEMDIVLDTDPSEVTEGGASQAVRPMGSEPAFEETEQPMEEEESYPEEQGTEDLSEQLQGD